MLLSCVLIIALALNYEVRECTGTISRKRHTRYSYVPVELDFMQEFGDNKSTTVEWNEVSGISEPQKMNYCVKIYENFYNVHVGKRRDFSSKADDVMLHSVYFRIPRTSPKDIRVLACRFRFDTVHNGTNDVLFIRPSKTWSRVYIFKKLRRNVFYLHTDIAVDRIDVFR